MSSLILTVSRRLSSPSNFIFQRSPDLVNFFPGYLFTLHLLPDPPRIRFPPPYDPGGPMSYTPPRVVPRLQVRLSTERSGLPRDMYCFPVTNVESQGRKGQDNIQDLR